MQLKPPLWETGHGAIRCGRAELLSLTHQEAAAVTLLVRWLLNAGFPPWFVRALAGLIGLVLLAVGAALFVGVLALEGLRNVPTQQLAATFHLKPDAQCRVDPQCLRTFEPDTQAPSGPTPPPLAVQVDAVQAPQALTLVVPHLAPHSGPNRSYGGPRATRPTSAATVSSGQIVVIEGRANEDRSSSH